MVTNSFAAGAYAATQGLSSGGLGAAKRGLSSAQGAGGPNFAGMLSGALDGVAQSGKAAEKQAVQAVSGRADIVDVVTAVAESEQALETLVAVRDRVIAAYEEIMRMPI